MKPDSRIGKAVLLALGSLFLSSCGNSPTGPSTPVVTWNDAEVYRQNDQGTVTSSVFLCLQVDGAPVSTAQVVLTGSSLSTPVTLAYSGIVNTSQAQYLHDGTGWTYQPGDTYTLTSVARGITVTSTLTAPGDITNSADGSTAVTQVSWLTEGNKDSVQVVDDFDSSVVFTTGTGDAVSPISINPVTVYPNLGVHDYLVTTLVQNKTVALSPASSGSKFMVWDKTIVFVSP